MAPTELLQLQFLPVLKLLSFYKRILYDCGAALQVDKCWQVCGGFASEPIINDVPPRFFRTHASTCICPQWLNKFLVILKYFFNFSRDSVTSRGACLRSQRNANRWPHPLLHPALCLVFSLAMACLFFSVNDIWCTLDPGGGGDELVGLCWRTLLLCQGSGSAAAITSARQPPPLWLRL